MSSLNIKIENFEGPFDLLLHLIKKNEMDIYNIKIYEITNHYIDYLNSMKELDLEITSEFIVMAATLLEIKSKMLLPKDKKQNSEEISEEDPREMLAQKLIEYNKFKKAAEFLALKKGQYGIVFSKKPEIIEDIGSNINNEQLLKDITMLDLYNLYNDLINKYNNKINRENTIQKEIPIDKYKIEDKMNYLKEILYYNKEIKFNEIVLTCSSKIEVIVTFLALLELIKERHAKVVQENNFSKIYIERAIENE